MATNLEKVMKTYYKKALKEQKKRQDRFMRILRRMRNTDGNDLQERLLHL